MNNHDELIIRLFINGKGIIKDRLNKINDYPLINKYILNRFKDSDSIDETIKRIKLNIEEKPICPCCGKPVKFIGKTSKMFQKYCSNSCRSKMINKYIWIDGQQKYNLEHYGVKYNVETEQFKQKRKSTLFDRYGNEKFNNIEKRNKTNLINHRNKNYNNVEQHKLTSMERYNVPYYNNPEQRMKTMKEHNSFKKSKPEDECYKLLKEKYPDVIRQYRDKNRYPFNCDFYIPSKDLFIEFQGSQYHHGRPYLGTEEDLLEVEQIKEDIETNKRHLEGKKCQGDSVLYTWTDLDVRKRNIAKQNNLNYLEFFNINEFLNWYDKSR